LELSHSFESINFNRYILSRDGLLLYYIGHTKISDHKFFAILSDQQEILRFKIKKCIWV